MTAVSSAIGVERPRSDAVVKVRGEARYAYEYPIDRIAYAYIVQSTIAKGRIERIDPREALTLDGVIAVISHEIAPRLQGEDLGDLAVMQSDRISYLGQVVAVVVAETLETARYAAGFVRVEYTAEPHTVVLDVERPDLYTPDVLNGDYKPDTFKGDAETAFALAPLKHEAVYTTPTFHNNPMEMHAAIADWRYDGLTVYDTNQGSNAVVDQTAKLLGLRREDVHVIAPYVGGGFGSKGLMAQARLVAILSSRIVRRPVKAALTRQQMFSLAGHRTPTHQLLRIGCERDGTIIAILHDTIEQSATIEEFAEQTGVATRVMYRTPNLQTTHLLATCDVPMPSWMRAPGECPGMYALESAIDETAIACGMCPVEFRILNEPSRHPDDDRPFSSRNVVACLREGARRFGWENRVAEPRARRDGRWLVGLGVASSIYPVYHETGNAARVSVSANGRYRVQIAASDMGQGTWTVLQIIAAEELEAALDAVTLEIGDSALPPASTAGGSSGVTNWGSAIVDACRELKRRIKEQHGGRVPAEGLTVEVQGRENSEEEQFAMYAFGAQFAEVRVDIDTGEIRVPRMCGIFAAGRILSPTTARSQFIGAMTMGLSMALHEQSVIDPRFGHYATHDFAEYHIAVNADVPHIDVGWIDERDSHVNRMGSKGIGEIGIVGTAAAIANAAYNATGIRVRDLPVTLDKLLLTN